MAVVMMMTTTTRRGRGKQGSQSADDSDAAATDHVADVDDVSLRHWESGRQSQWLTRRERFSDSFQATISSRERGSKT